MPSDEAKRRKARRRAERKAEQAKKQLQRWINLPKDLYPYESLYRVPAEKSAKDTQAIVQHQQYLPWPIPKTRHPCRPWHPQDLWETGALKKALFNELECCGNENTMGPSPPQGRVKQVVGHNAENCLRHILLCWNANFKNYESAGPSFLVHILKYRYDGPLTFSSLRNEDDKTATTLLRAAPGRSFHIILGQMKRTVYMRSVLRSECQFQELAHAGGKDVNVFPRLSEEDLLDEYSFEDQKADQYDGHSTSSWIRTVLVIVPREFIDDFIFEDELSYEPDDERAHYIANGQYGDIIDHDDHEEEDFECKDEEAMLERAHELSQYRLALEAEQDQDDEESDVEVQDEHGNTYMMPASMFNGSGN